MVLHFVARAAVRGVVRGAARGVAAAVVYDHVQARRQQQEAIARAQLAGPFGFQVSPDGETGIFQDRRIGFGHALPGFPRPMTPQAGPNEPPCEAMIGLCEVPVAVRYRLDRPQLAASSAADFVMRLAHAYASSRTPTTPSLELAPADRIASWRVESAATAQYPLPFADPWGADFEELVVQVLHGTAMTITVRYPHAFRESDWLRHALFSSASYAGISWDPQRPPHYVPRIWPESAILGPGLAGNLAPHAQNAVAQLSPAMPTAPPEREALSAALGSILSHDAPPWHALSPQEIAHHASTLLACSSSPPYHAAAQAWLGAVRTMHDLRGLAILLGRAMTTGDSAT